MFNTCLFGRYEDEVLILDEENNKVVFISSQEIVKIEDIFVSPILRSPSLSKVEDSLFNMREAGAAFVEGEFELRGNILGFLDALENSLIQVTNTSDVDEDLNAYDLDDLIEQLSSAKADILKLKNNDFVDFLKNDWDKNSYAIEPAILSLLLKAGTNVFFSIQSLSRQAYYKEYVRKNGIPIDFDGGNGFGAEELIELRQVLTDIEKAQNSDQSIHAVGAGCCGWDCYLVLEAANKTKNRDHVENHERLIKPVDSLPLFLGDDSYYLNTKAPAFSKILKWVTGQYLSPGTLGVDLAEYCQGHFKRNDNFISAKKEIDRELFHKRPVIVQITANHWVTLITYSANQDRYVYVNGSQFLSVTSENLEKMLNTELYQGPVAQVQKYLFLARNSLMALATPLWPAAYFGSCLFKNEHFSNFTEAYSELWRLKARANAIRKYKYIILDDKF